MIIPNWIKKGDTIGVTAVSDGVKAEEDIKRFENGKKKLNNIGYQVLFTDDVYKADETGRSTDGLTRWQEYEKLLDNKQVSAIISAKGGNFLNEMLPYVDYEKIKKNPKWFQGYSDNTCLVHSITTKCDIMTVYGSQFGDFGMEPWHKAVENNIDILEGKPVTQKSFLKYQENFGERITGLEGYNEDADVLWKCYGKDSGKVEFSGRMIGGCLDVLQFLHGTEYDATEEFVNKYKEDGIIWYMESFDTSGENLMMVLWKLRECGWFRYTKGFVFGRPLFYASGLNMPYEESVMYALGNLDVPVIFDSDIGHKGPRFTILNGAYTLVKWEDGRGTITHNNLHSAAKRRHK